MSPQPLAMEVVAAIRQVVGADRVSLHEPSFSGNEWDYVRECLDTGWVSSVGKFVDRFEQDLAAYTGVPHAVAVVNGTAGLQIALTVSGVSPRDEVFIPSLSFVATANAVVHAGAVPHFADCSSKTLGLCPDALADHLGDIAIRDKGGWHNRLTGRRLGAIVPMHTFGHPVDMPALLAVADRYALPVIEDAAESLGSRLNQQHTGTFGLCGVLSFNGNKIITTGGGGAILTADAQIARRAKHLTTTAKLAHPWAFRHDEVAYNFRMPNLNAALGCAQLERMDDFLARKRLLTRRYQEAFSDIPDLQLLLERRGTQANYWLQTLVLEPAQAGARDNILQATNDAGLMTRPIWELLHTLPMFQQCPRMPLPVSEDLGRRIINIPSSAGLVHD